jgi:hypothetical protein
LMGRSIDLYGPEPVWGVVILNCASGVFLLKRGV